VQKRPSPDLSLFKKDSAAAEPPRVNRVDLTLRRSLPIHPDNRTSSERAHNQRWSTLKNPAVAGGVLLLY
jgi:hypothetical protein